MSDRHDDDTPATDRPGATGPQAYGAQPGYGADPYGSPPGYGAQQGWSAQPGQYPAQPGQYPAQPGQYPAQPGQYPAQPGQYPAQPGPWAPYGQPAYVVQRSTNGLAVASMVLGILWIYWVGSILALVFGYVARQQIKQRGESGDGMAIAGIVLGYVGLGMLALVFVIGFSTAGL